MTLPDSDWIGWPRIATVVCCMVATGAFRTGWTFPGLMFLILTGLAMGRAFRQEDSRG